LKERTSSILVPGTIENNDLRKTKSFFSSIFCVAQTLRKIQCEHTLNALRKL
jgi:hypothetical protein